MDSEDLITISSSVMGSLRVGLSFVKKSLIREKENETITDT